MLFNQSYPCSSAVHQSYLRTWAKGLLFFRTCALRFCEEAVPWCACLDVIKLKWRTGKVKRGRWGSQTFLIFPLTLWCAAGNSHHALVICHGNRKKKEKTIVCFAVRFSCPVISFCSHWKGPMSNWDIRIVFKNKVESTKCNIFFQ